MAFNYKLGIHSHTEDYEEMEITVQVPIGMNESVVLECGESVKVIDIEHHLNPSVTHVHVLRDDEPKDDPEEEIEE